jgi:4-hydroxybenzoate polyprenyltransferase
MERLFSKILSKNKITSFIDLVRPWNSATVALISLLGIKLAGDYLPNLWFILPLIVFIIYNGSTALNDIFDIRVDTINMPFRPLERGSLKVKSVINFCIFSYILGNLIALLVSFQFFLSILLMSLSGILYSMPPISLKDRGILGNFDLGFASAFTTLYAGYVISTNSLIISYNILTSMIVLTILFTFFSILKDFKDLKGDKIHKKRTIANTYGIRSASKINIIGTLLFFPITIITFYYLNIQSLLFIITSFSLFIALLLVELKVLKSPTQQTGEKAWGLGRFIFLIFILTLLFI